MQANDDYPNSLNPIRKGQQTCTVHCDVVPHQTVVVGSISGEKVAQLSEDYSGDDCKVCLVVMLSIEEGRRRRFGISRGYIEVDGFGLAGVDVVVALPGWGDLAGRKPEEEEEDQHSYTDL